MRIKCLAQERNAVPRPGPELGLLDQESSALINHWPLRLIETVDKSNFITVNK